MPSVPGQAAPQECSRKGRVGPRAFKLVSTYIYIKKNYIYMGAGPTTMAWAADEEEVNQGGQGTTGETVGESRFHIVRTKLRIILGSKEDVEVEEDPSEDSEWEEEPASSTGSGRVAGPKLEGEQKSPVRSG
ncbi:hypothetical protein Bca52824_082510 [Brassica carinata]|uniref:Uncharacterized protein n=1 Tax=Brassica carinata TaxID=52824 RepID=A0A8X7TSN4_BRACI|nr:hypothetical protein Bca52824_082510 [Brassica carinata]